MLTTSERISLRDELFNKLKEQGVIIFYRKKKYYGFCNNTHTNLAKTLNENDDITHMYYLYISDFRTEKEAQYCLLHHDDFSNHVCSVCNSRIKQFYYPKGYRNSCGHKDCIKALIGTDEAKKKRSKSNLNKYGVENVSQAQSVKDKKIESTMKHYNVKNPFQAEEVKQKIKEANLANLGVEYPMQSAAVRAKSEESCLRKYGVKHIGFLKAVHEKAIITCLNSYGTRRASQSDIVKNKAKVSNLEKYGVENVAQQHITNYNIWSNDKKFKEYIIDEYNKKGMFLSLCDIYPFFNVSQGCLKNKLEDLELLDYFYIQNSQLEIDFETFLKKYNISFQKRNRSILIDNTDHYFEIDFLISNMGIEINDISTHNSFSKDKRFSKDPLYHQQKSLLAIEKNIRLIHLWEWELRNENEWSKISNWLLNELNQSKQCINLQECELVYVPKNIEKEFYNLYSIKEYQDSYVCIGLMYNNLVYQIMSFKQQDNQWVLINYGTAYGYYTDKGYKDIVDSFIQSTNAQSLKIYYNLDKDDTTIYGQLFELKLNDILEPTIIWCNTKMKHFNNIDNDKGNFVPIYNSGLLEYELTTH